MSHTQLTRCRWLPKPAPIWRIGMTGHLQAEIAEIVGRDQGTIGRELAKYLMAFKAEGSPLIAELAK